MKRSNLGTLLIASIAAASVFAPTARQAGHVESNRVITTQSRAETPKLPANNGVVSSVNQIRGLLPSSFELTQSHWCMWPHNRPQPGWRKVQSRARHAERARRQRRNA